VYGRLLAGIAGLNPTGGVDVRVVKKRENVNCRTVKTKMKYRVQANKKNTARGMDVCLL
jgi:hypothetical protein